MNSTKFFQKWLRPLQKNYFSKGFDKEATSYFVTRKNRQMTKEMFELGSQMNAATFTNSLLILWTETDTPELRPLAKPLADLAQSVYSIENQSEEVSPFIYVMY